jgi:hypothetical protein
MSRIFQSKIFFAVRMPKLLNNVFLTASEVNPILQKLGEIMKYG